MGRLPGRAGVDASVHAHRLGRRRHLAGDDLARLHDHRQGRVLRRLPGAHRARRVLAVLRRVRRRPARRAAASTTRPAPATDRRRPTRGTTRASTSRPRSTRPNAEPPPAEEVAPKPGPGDRQRERERQRERHGPAGRGRRAGLIARGRARADRRDRDGGRRPQRQARALERATTRRSRAHGPFAVTSIDTLVDGVHFGRHTHSARDIGWKALATALSDLAAMGAEAGEAYVAVVLPEGFERGARARARDGGAGGAAA